MTKTFTISVYGPLSITTTSLPVGKVGTSYSKTLAATGGLVPYAWSITAGTLPAGLTWNGSTGTISGTSQAEGMTNITVQVTDVNNLSIAKTLALTVSNKAITSFSITNPSATGTIDEAAKTVSVTLPYGADLTSLVASFAITGTKATVGATTQVSGTTSNNFVNPVVYVVTAPDLSTASYTVTITTAPYDPVILPVAGYGIGYVYNGDNKQATLASLSAYDVVTDSAGNIYIADADNNRIRKVTISTGIITTFAGTGTAGFSGDGSAATSAKLNCPQSLAIDSTGNLYIGDACNYRVRKVDTSGKITTVAGNGQATFGGDNGLATLANLDYPSGLAVDGFGNIYIADLNNSRIRKVTASTGLITTVAGNGTPSFNGDGGSATLASLLYPAGVAVDSSGNVFIADRGSHRIRKVTTDGIIATVAGHDQWEYDGDGVPATQASLSADAVKVDNAGNIYIADGSNDRIRKVNTNGIITTLAGNGIEALLGDGGLASQASLYYPEGIGIDSSGNIYVADNMNYRVRKIDIMGLVISTGSLPNGATGTGYSRTLAATGGKTPYTWTLAAGSLPSGYSLSTAGTITGTTSVAGTYNFTVKVKDTNNIVSTKVLAIAVYAPLSITTTSLASGTTGSVYSQTLAATGGQPSYVWSTTTGTLPSGLSLSAAGVLSGTPVSAATSTVTYKVTDAGNTTITKSLSITISVPLSVTTSTLTSGTTGTLYSQTLLATGGTGTYTWSKTTGTLPTGYTLTSAGTITGTTSTTGTYNFTVQVKDGSNTTSTKDLSISVYTPLSITTTTLASGLTGSAYIQTLAATGGLQPYAWSIMSGTLPSGLSLSTAGTITGTPVSAGTSTVTFKVTDATSKTSTKALRITIGAPLSVTTSTLPSGTMGISYNQTLLATGGTGTYTWSKTTGTLPTGYTLNSAGTITGTTSTTGTFNFTVQVKDGSNATNTKALSISVYTPLSVTTTSLPSGTVNTTYSQTLAAAGGNSPYTWTLSSGSLPSGLTLTGATGVITGKPTKKGTSSFTVKATDASLKTATKSLSIVVN